MLVPPARLEALPRLSPRCGERPWQKRSWQKGARLSIFGLMATSTVTVAPRRRKSAGPRRRPSSAKRKTSESALLQVEDAEENVAFLMLKPHANKAEARAFVEACLDARGIEIVKSGSISAEEIERRSLIDLHYGPVAEKALRVDPKDLKVPHEGQRSFKACFGIPWEVAVQKDLVCNAKQAMHRLQCNSKELGTLWDELKLGTGKVKFGGGFYCGRLQGIYVINGFYMAMRAKYLLDNSAVQWFSLRWESSKLSWKRFREEVMGETDPATAAESHPSSIRGHFFKDWQRLGLSARPHVGDNAIHGSASPLEALIERMNWLQSSFEKDSFGRLLVSKGITEERVKKWRQNQTVKVDDEMRPLFDHVENKDTRDCISWLLSNDSGAEKAEVEDNVTNVSFYRNPDLLQFLMSYTHPMRRCMP